jgi:hypothetical protein
MGEAHLTTVAARHHTRHHKRIVSAAPVTPAFGQFPFRLWNHIILLNPFPSGTTLRVSK